ncbi:MAG: hypothetical protein O7J95_01020, partial [Planctomycetota bacterium]|nr:hypothetical protein [Planctomycetota bacterium]
MRRASITLSALVGLLLSGNALLGQCTDGRVFLSTPETIGIWEMNNLPVLAGEVLVDGTVVPDLSGNGLDAVVEGNASNNLVVGEGDPVYDTANTTNTTVVKSGGGGPPRLVVNDDTAFQFTEADDWSVELYIRRDETAGNQSWGLLAGTWLCRNDANNDTCPNCDFGCRNT